MCGRTSLFLPPDELESRFGARLVDTYERRYNVAPDQDLEVVTSDAPGEIARYRWGLVPDWRDGAGGGHINARSETAHEKPAFRAAWESRPCLVCASGYYEWGPATGGSGQPYRIHREDDPAVAMAGLWEPSSTDAVDVSDGGASTAGSAETDGTANSSRGTVAILTTEPTDVVAPIHDRMPVILPRDAESTWLTAGPDARRDLCRPYPDDDLASYPVSTRVNDPAVDDPGVIEPAASQQSGLDEFA